MTVTIERLAAYVAIDPTDVNLPALLQTATDMVNDYLREDGLERCPASVYDLAILQLGSELFVRRNSPGGIASWGPEGSAPARLSSDAMISVAPLLNRYRGIGAVG